MQEIRAPPEGHIDEAVAGVFSRDNDGIELGQLVHKVWVRNVAITTDLSENLNSFFSASICDEPSTGEVSESWI